MAYMGFNPFGPQQPAYVAPRLAPMLRGRRVNNMPRRKAPFIGSKNKRTGGYVGAELKFSDTARPAAQVAVTWANIPPNRGINPADGTTENITPGCLSAVAVGTGESQHDGRCYYIDSINIRGVAEATKVEAANAPFASTAVRIIILIDTQTNASGITPGDVMEDNPDTFPYHNFRNLEFVSRFRILMDKTINLNLQSLASPIVQEFSRNSTQVQWSFFHKFKKQLKVSTTAPEAVVASITDNSIHIIACADVAATVGVTFSSRLRFTNSRIR